MAKTISIDTTGSVSVLPFSVVKTGNSSTLNGDISSSATTIALSNASTFASSGSIRINEELITYSNKSGNNLTGCVRNYYYSPVWIMTDGTVTSYGKVVLGGYPENIKLIKLIADGEIPIYGE